MRRGQGSRVLPRVYGGTVTTTQNPPCSLCNAPLWKRGKNAAGRQMYSCSKMGCPNRGRQFVPGAVRGNPTHKAKKEVE